MRDKGAGTVCCCWLAGIYIQPPLNSPFHQVDSLLSGQCESRQPSERCYTSSTHTRQVSQFSIEFLVNIIDKRNKSLCSLSLYSLYLQRVQQLSRRVFAPVYPFFFFFVCRVSTRANLPRVALLCPPPVTLQLSGRRKKSSTKIGRFMEFWARMRNVFGCDELNKNRDIWRMLMAEFVGPLFLVLIGCASCVEGWNDQYSPHIVQVALSFGVTIATMAQALGHVSGGHFNPAVTVACLVTGKISIVKSIFYIVAQCLGAICGAALLQALTPSDFHNTLGVTEIHKALTPTQGFGVEFFSTFTLVLVVFGVCDENRKDVKGSAPLAIGLCIATAILATGNYTGGSLNPARSLGPAVISNKWAYHWVYWAGPIVGGVVAALTYQKAFKARSPEEEVELESYQYRVANSKESEIIADRTTTI